jgi:proline iminopeptidase
MFIKTRDGLNLYVNKVGNGLNCIYIHGGPGAWSKDFEEFSKRYLDGILSTVHIDQRGSGRSEGSCYSDYSIDTIVDDIEEVRKKLNIEKFILLAHSFGGIIATTYANKYSQYLEGLILMNCTLNMKESLKSQIVEGCNLLDIGIIDYNDDLISNWKNIAFNLVRKNMYYKLQYKEYANYLRVEEIDKGILNTSMSEQAFNNECYFYDYSDISDKIEIPTLIIIGDRDYAIGVEHYRTFKFKNSIVKTISGKHTPYIEDPVELTTIIKSFVLNL